jgi:hypothetical protein
MKCATWLLAIARGESNVDYQPFWWESCQLILAHTSKQPDVAWWGAPLFSALLAAIGAVAGSWIAISFDRKKAVNQELVKKRLELYSTYVPLANDLYCFLMKVGDFRSMTPTAVLEHKRKLDQFIHLYGPLFTGGEVVNAYTVYIRLCFNTFAGAGVPARIRADPGKLAKQYGGTWQTTWNNSFDATDVPDIQQLNKAYYAFVNAFAAQVGARR